MMTVSLPLSLRERAGVGETAQNRSHEIAPWSLTDSQIAKMHIQKMGRDETSVLDERLSAGHARY